MKKSFGSMPRSMEGIERYGFSWMDFVTSIPSPIFLVTGYKANGKPNACLQSWATFVGDDEGFYCILAAVNTRGHLYRSARETGVMVLNFPSADIAGQSFATIRNNAVDDDEIALSGLTAVPAETVNAPAIAECFLQLECETLWERPLRDGSGHRTMCLKVKNIVMDEAHFDAKRLGRYGKTGYMYNVHMPVNPVTGEAGEDGIAILQALPAEE